MKKKKLVFFDFVTHYGGAQRSTVLLCQQLMQFNELHVIDAYGICQDYIEALADFNIPTHVLQPAAKTFYIGHQGKPFKRTSALIKQIGSLLKMCGQLIKQTEKIKPDIIWTNSTKALGLLFLCRPFRKYSLVMYARRWYRYTEVSALERWLIRKADFVLAISGPTAKALESWGVRKEKIRVVYIAIDFDKVIEDSQKEFVTHPPQMDKPLKILVPAQLIRTKGQHTAVEAANLLRKRGLDFVMWLAGDVKIGVGNKYYEYLQKLISDYGLETNVFLLGDRKDVRALMRLSTVIIFPTHTEGLGRVIEEAMILKRPVISTPAGGVTGLIIDGKTGLLGPIDDAEAIVRNLEKLISDKDLVSQITNKAYEHVLENFSLKRHVELVRSAFEKVIKNGLV